MPILELYIVKKKHSKHKSYQSQNFTIYPFFSNFTKTL